MKYMISVEIDTDVPNKEAMDHIWRFLDRLPKLIDPANPEENAYKDLIAIIATDPHDNRRRTPSIWLVHQKKERPWQRKLRRKIRSAWFKLRVCVQRPRGSSPSECLPSAQ